jgi:ATP-dependent helicase HrpB
MLAARVAQERGVELGGEIGFQTRFETLVSDATRACFITEGILPRMLLSNRVLAGVSVIVFDEFHERNLATDVGLAVAVHLARTRRPDLRLIVMSATIDAAPIARYLGGAEIVDCPGRTHPIDIRYTSAPKTASPWDLAAEAVGSLITRGAEGDILVFMPGAYEIRRSQQAIEQAVRGEPASVVALYGDLPSAKQREVMEPTARRKIIVATNIAETSLTIPGVRHVVDAGLARVSRYDPCRGFNTLFIEPISRASADQRAGRAGREAPGICVRLWSSSQHAGRAAVTTPEIGRVDLAETVLQLRTLGFETMEEVPWFQAPAPAALQAARELLDLLGAVTAAGALTDRGRDLCAFPMHLRLAAFAAALLSERSAISGKPDYPDIAHQQDAVSDLFGQFCLLEKARESGFDPALCARNAINTSAAQAVFRTQSLFLQYCGRFGMRDRDADDAPAGLCRSLLAAYPDHLCVRRDQGTLLCNLRAGRRGELAKESLVRKARLFVAAEIREIKTAKSEIKTILSLAAEIKEQWLSEDFPGAWSRESRLEWNPAARAVEGRTQTTCLGVAITDAPSGDIDRLKASALLAETILSKGLELSAWDQGVEQWINRVRWVAGVFPEEGFPLFSDDDRRMLVGRLCEGELQYERVRVKPVLPLLQGMLTPRQRDFLERTAPASFALPSGRNIRILYEPGAPPRGRARIQELFGLRESPKIAGGRASLLIEILAPNNRPVQITDDLARFWTVHYPDIKKTLSRRYPKHEWR